MTGAIWLASFPKSGNTWARLALRSLLEGGSAVALDDIADFSPLIGTFGLMDRWLETETGLMTDAEVEALRPDFHAAYFDRPGPQLCKVHDAWVRTHDGRPLFDAAITAGAIYLIRDPRDVAISYAHYLGSGLDRAIRVLSDPNTVLGDEAPRRGRQVRQQVRDWSLHVTSWIDDSGLAPLVVRYEDMLADPQRELARMAGYLGWPLDADAVARAVSATRFERLADQERRSGFAERGDKTERFFRAGVSGQWRDTLTPEQVARIETRHGAVMARFGYL